ncbi:uncharacterized protein SCHCODRAFT_02685200 [Schizophyllum commune H4-8]|nr:uncharacterized protein SCHCODRAFT_02685200 [Schizophyllum commune H4-8]KAI5896134.1 hypothetical protein SCHCODRAFT_02685200 [Schizophyllum commune H4-8]
MRIFSSFSLPLLLGGLVPLLGHGAQPATAIQLPVQVPFTGLTPHFYTIQNWWSDMQDRNTSPRDYWRELFDHARQAVQVAFQDLSNMQQRFPEARASIEEFIALVRSVVEDAAHLRPPTDLIPNNLENAGAKIGKALMAILEQVKTVFPPPSNAPSHEERLALAENVVGRAVKAVEEVLVRRGVDEEKAHRTLEHMARQLVRLVVITGERPPRTTPGPLCLCDLTAAAMIIPEGWILSRLLGMLGFGPAGPIKGSSAAWMQRRFWGATVAKGSWFAWLQRAGMKVPVKVWAIKARL